MDPRRKKKMLLKFIEGAPDQLEGSQGGVSVGGSVERDLKEQEEAGRGKQTTWAEERTPRGTWR